MLPFVSHDLAISDWRATSPARHRPWRSLSGSAESTDCHLTVPEAGISHPVSLGLDAIKAGGHPARWCVCDGQRTGTGGKGLERLPGLEIEGALDEVGASRVGRERKLEFPVSRAGCAGELGGGYDHRITNGHAGFHKRMGSAVIRKTAGAAEGVRPSFVEREQGAVPKPGVARAGVPGRVFLGPDHTVANIKADFRWLKGEAGDINADRRGLKGGYRYPCADNEKRQSESNDSSFGRHFVEREFPKEQSRLVLRQALLPSWAAVGLIGVGREGE
jgi:hypothetical protein